MDDWKGLAILIAIGLAYAAVIAAISQLRFKRSYHESSKRYPKSPAAHCRSNCASQCGKGARRKP